MANFEKYNQRIENGDRPLSINEERLYTCLLMKDDFLVLGATNMETIVEVAEDAGYEVMPIKLESKDILTGERYIKDSPSDIVCTYRDVLWAHPIEDHPDKNYLVLFDIDDADDPTFTALGSIIKTRTIQAQGKRMDNFLVGVVCGDAEREISSVMQSILRVFHWVDDN